MWLIDKSALVRISQSVDAETWAERMSRGVVHLAPVTRLEVGYSARTDAASRQAFASSPLNHLRVEYSTPAVEDRALEVQFLLADKGQHRAPSIADLLVAAVAELAGLTILHLDKDFDLIAEITGQPAERLRL